MHLVTQYLCPSLVNFSGLFLLGYIFLYKPTKLLFGWLHNNACSSCKSTKILKSEPNDYAIVTGATDGIGLEYARQLAEKGFNLLLLSRTEEKLKRVAGEIQEMYPQCKKIEIFTVDFSTTDIYDRIKVKLDSLEGQIYILVNNVGIMYPIPELFTEYPEGFHLKMINANIVSMTVMSEMVIKKMLNQKSGSNDKRPKGVVINISSAAGFLAIPTFSVYGASKAYMNYLGKILTAEYQSKGIIVQTVTPNQVITNLSRELHEPAVAVKADLYVRYALKSVGTESMTSAHPKHKLVNNLIVMLKDYTCETWLMKKILDAMLKKSTELKEKNK